MRLVLFAACVSYVYAAKCPLPIQRHDAVLTVNPVVTSSTVIVTRGGDAFAPIALSFPHLRPLSASLFSQPGDSVPRPIELKSGVIYFSLNSPNFPAPICLSVPFAPENVVSSTGTISVEMIIPHIPAGIGSISLLRLVAVRGALSSSPSEMLTIVPPPAVNVGVHIVAIPSDGTLVSAIATFIPGGNLPPKVAEDLVKVRLERETRNFGFHADVLGTFSVDAVGGLGSSAAPGGARPLVVSNVRGTGVAMYASSGSSVKGLTPSARDSEGGADKADVYVATATTAPDAATRYVSAAAVSPLVDMARSYLLKRLPPCPPHFGGKPRLCPPSDSAWMSDSANLGVVGASIGGPLSVTSATGRAVPIVMTGFIAEGDAPSAMPPHIPPALYVTDAASYARRVAAVAEADDDSVRTAASSGRTAEVAHVTPAHYAETSNRWRAATQPQPNGVSYATSNALGGGKDIDDDGGYVLVVVFTTPPTVSSGTAGSFIRSSAASLSVAVLGAADGPSRLTPSSLFFLLCFVNVALLRYRQ